MKVKIETSVADFLDRWSILIIKLDKGLDVSKELKGYTGVFVGPKHDPAHDYFLNILKSVNLQLWDLEDRKRKGVERYSKEESDVAFLITQLNDLRHETKKRVDSYFKSEFTERKSH